MALGKLNRKSGFTLPELLISIGLFAMVWSSLVGSILVGKMAEVRARHRIQATYAAQFVMESQRRLPYDSIATVTTAVDIEIDSKGPLTGEYTINVTSVGGALYKRVTVNIAWVERTPLMGAMAASESLSTYISQAG